MSQKHMYRFQSVFPPSWDEHQYSEVYDDVFCSFILGAQQGSYDLSWS